MGRMTDGVKHLLIINVLLFAASLLYQDQLYDVLSLWYPENPNFRIWQVVTHMFMHSNGFLLHIVFNMYGLWMFGTPLERQWGMRKFLFFYFSAGLGAALVYTGVNYYVIHRGVEALVAAGQSQSEIMALLYQGKYNPAWMDMASPEVVNAMLQTYYSPMLGASGAVYGIFMAFAMTYPNLELMLMFIPIPIKAKYMIAGLIVLDLFSGITGQSVGGVNVANFAHLGGALFGFLMMWYWRRNQFDKNRWDL